jgi:Protein of unknown function (DUF3305)
MSPVSPLLRIPVGIVVERRKTSSRWADVIWRPVTVLAGLPDASPWTILATDGETVTFYAGEAEIELYRSDTDNYRRNLETGMPSVWVALKATSNDPPYEIAAVTADPAEAEGLTESAQAIVEAVAMPESVRDAVAAFVAEHHVERIFEKRARDRADPEALARRGRRLARHDER